MFAVFEDATPLVEGLSIDEAFLDVRGMRAASSGTPVEIAARLRRAVRERVGLPVTVGVARTKFLAKVASGVAKPDGLLVVPPDGELAFLHPLPVERLWGVGRRRRGGSTRGIRTVGEVARSRSRRSSRCSAARPAVTFTRSRTTAIAVASEPAGGAARSARSARSGSGAASPETIDATLVGIVDRVTGGCARARRVGRTVVLRLRFDDFSRATRSHTLPVRDRRDTR